MSRRTSAAAAARAAASSPGAADDDDLHHEEDEYDSGGGVDHGWKVTSPSTSPAHAPFPGESSPPPVPPTDSQPDPEELTGRRTRRIRITTVSSGNDQAQVQSQVNRQVTRDTISPDVNDGTRRSSRTASRLASRKLMNASDEEDGDYGSEQRDDVDVEGEADADADADAAKLEEEDEEPVLQARTTRSGRLTRPPQPYGQSLYNHEEDSEDDVDPAYRPRRSTRKSSSVHLAEAEESDEAPALRPRNRRRSSGRSTNHDEEQPRRASTAQTRVQELARKRKAAIKSKSAQYTGPRYSRANSGDAEHDEDDGPIVAGHRLRSRNTKHQTRSSRRRTRAGSEDDFASSDAVSGQSTDSNEEAEMTPSEEEAPESQGMRLRARKEVNYTLPGSAPAAQPGTPRRKGPYTGLNGPAWTSQGAKRGGAARSDLPFNGAATWDQLPKSMTGKDLARAFGEKTDSSDSDDYAKKSRSRKGAGGAGKLPTVPGAVPGASGLLGTEGSGVQGDLSGMGAADTMGRLKAGGDSMADIDPLGTDMQIDFDSVGGLDGTLQQLKEMVTLPLLYPELYQQFHITPPRGVLFHGPPGTGKTLVARALAASVSGATKPSHLPPVGQSSANPQSKDASGSNAEGISALSADPTATAQAQPAEQAAGPAPTQPQTSQEDGGQKVAFFMRKGADVLSKWVGEAERQLRLLFEEAKRSQPAIIFFDEIDGLAPVRSSKQDQIHASIVSTLLALMDGMDGRGQVVVIGATNRPDSVDPALRRPGRFDREFYFPLPLLPARESILKIHTKLWEPQPAPEMLHRLAELTKGYGGADLRALCTEAALNAVQRTYPQIYQTTDRLLLHPDHVRATPKDFMLAISKIVPSSARSASSQAAPVPDHLKTLLAGVEQVAREDLEHLLPPSKQRTALEEALWEDPAEAQALQGSGTDAFAHEVLLQQFTSLRVYRPRMLVYGRAGNGQKEISRALLYHLEGYHVSSMDLPALLGDPARPPDSAIVQLFIEARRHKPSVLFAPSLQSWTTDTIPRSTLTLMRSLLDGLATDEPVLLLGVADCPLDELDPEVAEWFGDTGLLELTEPERNQRQAFFRPLLEYLGKPPPFFPGGLPKRPRVLEALPLAPALPPRQPTAQEVQEQVALDERMLEQLKFKLGPVLAELRKKFKVFTKDVWEEYNLSYLTSNFPWKREKGRYILDLPYDKPPEEIEKNRRARAAAKKAEVQRKKQAKAAKRAEIQAAQQQQDKAQASIAAGQIPADAPAPGVPASDGLSMVPLHNGVAPGIAFVEGSTGTVPTPQNPFASETQGTDPTVATATNETDVTMHDAEEDDGNEDADAVTAAAQAADEEEADTITWQRTVLYTTTLERMQKKLYYDCYFCTSAFVDDLQKIVHNAQAAEVVDGERALKAHQMLNTASILLDQCVEPQFRVDCERLAVRVAQREEQSEKEAKAKESAKKDNGLSTSKDQGSAPSTTSGDPVAQQPPVPYSNGGSAPYPVPNSALQPETQAPFAPFPASGVPGAPGAPGSTPSTPGVNGHKRPHATDPDDIWAKKARFGQPSSASPTPRLTAPTGFPTAYPTAYPAPSSLPKAPGQASIWHTEPHPPPAPPAPTLHLPLHLVGEVQAKLEGLEGFSLEELESVRAACFDRLWTHRSSWDREPVLRGMLRAIDHAIAARGRRLQVAAQRAAEALE